MQQQMKIQGLMIDPVSNMPIIILKDEANVNTLPIWVGVFEANAIAMQLEKIEAPRPMTHDLLRNLVRELSAKVERIEINDLKQNTFYATIYLSQSGETIRIDARPSDAMALALRADAPIFVDAQVIEKSTSGSDEPAANEAERLRKWLEEVDPEEFGRYEM